MMNEFDTDFSLGGLAIAPNLMFSVPPSPTDGDESSPQLSRMTSAEVSPQNLLPIDKEALMRYVFNDHTYSKPFPSYRSKHDQLVQPAKVLQLVSNQVKMNGTSHIQSDGEDIDIESPTKPPIPIVRYDHEKARYVMNEVETYLNSLWKDVDKDDEEKFTRGTWSREQGKFFDSAYKIINNYQLAKLTYDKNPNEAVLRKLALDKATKRLRKHYGSFFWNGKLIGWLHGIMIDCMGSSGFLCYLEIIQSLKRLVPSLVERTLMIDRTASEKEQTAGLPNLGSKLKRSWDPSLGVQTNLSLDKFPVSPFFIIIPSGPSIPQQSSKRSRFWNNQLARFGKPFTINAPAYRTPEGYVIKHYLEHCISSARAKIKECLDRYPDRPICLVGWGTGAIVSIKIALLEKVDAVICLGFPINGLGEVNQNYWNELTKIECPIQFIIGCSAPTNSKEKIEEFRSKMKVQTNMILLSRGDELLRIPKSEKRVLGVTQVMIDKLVQDEIYIFLKEILHKQRRSGCTNISPPKKKKRKADIEQTDEMKGKKKKPKAGSPKVSNNAECRDTTSAQLQRSVNDSRNLPSYITTVSDNSTDKCNIDVESPLYTLATPTTTTTLLNIVGQKRILPQNKDNVKKVKPSKKPSSHSNKPHGSVLSNQRFTANLGNQKAGNLLGQHFSMTLNKELSASRESSATFATGSINLSTSNSPQPRFRTSSSGFCVQSTTKPSNEMFLMTSTKSLQTKHEDVIASIKDDVIDKTLITEGNEAALYLSNLNQLNIDKETAAVSSTVIASSPSTTHSSLLIKAPNIDLSNFALLNSVTDVSLLAKFLASAHSTSAVEAKEKSSPTSAQKVSVKLNDNKISVSTSLDGSKKVTYNPSKNKHVYGMPSPVSQKMKVPRLKSTKPSSGLIQISKTHAGSRYTLPFSLSISSSRQSSPFTLGIDSSLNNPLFSSSTKREVSVTASCRSASPSYNKVLLTSSTRVTSSITTISRSNTPIASSIVFSYPSALLTAKIKELSAKSLHQPKLKSAVSSSPNLLVNFQQSNATVSRQDIQKAAQDIKLVNVLNTCRYTAANSKLTPTQKDVAASFLSEELITPRKFEQNIRPSSSSLVDHLFTSMAIPVELERGSADDSSSIDFSISPNETSKTKRQATCKVTKKPSVVVIDNREKLKGEKQLSSHKIDGENESNKIEHAITNPLLREMTHVSTQVERDTFIVSSTPPQKTVSITIKNQHTPIKTSSSAKTVSFAIQQSSPNALTTNQVSPRKRDSETPTTLKQITSVPTQPVSNISLIQQTGSSQAQPVSKISIVSQTGSSPIQSVSNVPVLKNSTPSILPVSNNLKYEVVSTDVSCSTTFVTTGKSAVSTLPILTTTSKQGERSPEVTRKTYPERSPEVSRKIYPERSSKSSNVTIQKIVAERKSKNIRHPGGVEVSKSNDRLKVTSPPHKNVTSPPADSQYVTRSGRVMKARFFVPEDHGKTTTKNSLDDNDTTLGNLLNAANEIKKDNKVDTPDSGVSDQTTTESSKDIAATAMLELQNVVSVTLEDCSPDKTCK